VQTLAQEMQRLDISRINPPPAAKVAAGVALIVVKMTGGSRLNRSITKVIPHVHK